LSFSPIAHAESFTESEIVYVGDKPTWKDPSIPVRIPPISLTDIPTILKFDAKGKIVGRIVEAAILDEVKLEKFLKET
jgi:hypothetical protein